MEYIREIINDYSDKIDWSEDNLQNALSIYGLLKKDERLYGNKKELEFAKSDLDKLQISYDGLTKNKIYLKHQSEFVNGIYYIIEREK